MDGYKVDITVASMTAFFGGFLAIHEKIGVIGCACDFFPSARGVSEVKGVES